MQLIPWVALLILQRFVFENIDMLFQLSISNTVLQLKILVCAIEIYHSCMRCCNEQLLHALLYLTALYHFTVTIFLLHPFN